uniref:Caspase-8 n=1 Tax=Paracentrotus lividus TaxID=7656 RepID=A8TVN9_PARLI|nr:caspase-8 [Paracentrotus lividus]
MAFPTSYSDSTLVNTDVVRDANPGADSLKYRGLLKEIDNGLGIRDMEKLKYLCQDLGVAPRKFESMTRGIYLFTELEKLALITADDISLLVDLMKAINRYDLVKKLKSWSSKEGTLAHRLSGYRRLMLRISDSLSRDEREQFTFYLSGGDSPLPVADIEESKTLLQLFSLMEKYTLIGPGDVDYLSNIMKSIGSVAIVKEIEKYQASESSSSVPNMQSSISPSFQQHQGGGMAYHTGNTGNTRSNSAPTLQGYMQNPTWYGQGQHGVPPQYQQQHPHHTYPQEQPYHNLPPQQYQQVQQQASPPSGQQHWQQQAIKREPEDTTSSATSSLTIGPERPKWYYEAVNKYGSARADDLWEKVVQRMRVDDARKKMQEMKIREQRSSDSSTPSIKTEPEEQEEMEASVSRNLPLEAIEDTTSSSESQQTDTSADDGHRIVPAQTATVRPQTDDIILPKYNMTRLPRGLCIIFNAEHFHRKTKLDDRKGTEKDVEALQNTFYNRLKFKTCVKKDPTARDYVTCLTEIAAMDHTNFDCFVCIILSHGCKGRVYGTDGDSVAIDDLTNLFRGAYVKSLVSKPKLFFIQACQGREAQEAVDIQQDSTPSIPNESDTLLSLSTVPGYASNRSISQGTWYISSLCNVINAYYKKVDLLTMLTMVNNLLSQAADREKGKQIGNPSHTLRKQIYFNQGLGD